MNNNDPKNKDPNPDDRDTREMGPAYRPHAVTKTAATSVSDAELANAPDFDGRTYNAKKDKKRLTKLLILVHNFMSDSKPHTLEEIRAHIGRGSEAGISARIRDLRKKQFGGMTVIRRRRGDPTRGLWEYVLVKATAETEHGEKWEGT